MCGVQKGISRGQQPCTIAFICFREKFCADRFTMFTIFFCSVLFCCLEMCRMRSSSCVYVTYKYIRCTLCSVYVEFVAGVVLMLKQPRCECAALLSINARGLFHSNFRLLRIFLCLHLLFYVNKC